LTFNNLPLGALLGLILYLMLRAKDGLAKPAAIAALVALASIPENILPTLAKVGPGLASVLVIMSVMQLAVTMILENGAEDGFNALIARITTNRLLSKVPASVLIPAIFMPTAMLSAALIHNIPAVALLAPLAFTLCNRLQIPWAPTVFGLIPASNLGGASAAWGDTPAIIQRLIWHFDVPTFTANMLPRNLVILALLTLTTTIWSAWGDKGKRQGWRDIYERLRIRDSLNDRSQAIKTSLIGRYIGLSALVVLFLAQIFAQTMALAISMLTLAALFTARNPREFVRSVLVLGDEAVIAIAALLTLSSCIEQTPLLHHLAESFLQGERGTIEITAYFITALISADGAAAMLAQTVHDQAHGSFESAWSLASGICAGSTAMLTSASAGPVLIEVSRRMGAPLTFRHYAAFGLPFSLLMLLAYLGLDFLKTVI